MPQEKDPLEKGYLWAPFAVSILTSWLLETVLSCCLCDFFLPGLPRHVVCHKQTGSSLQDLGFEVIFSTVMVT